MVAAASIAAGVYSGAESIKTGNLMLEGQKKGMAGMEGGRMTQLMGIAGVATAGLGGVGQGLGVAARAGTIGATVGRVATGTAAAAGVGMAAYGGYSSAQALRNKQTSTWQDKAGIAMGFLGVAMLGVGAAAGAKAYRSTNKTVKYNTAAIADTVENAAALDALDAIGEQSYLKMSAEFDVNKPGMNNTTQLRGEAQITNKEAFHQSLIYQERTVEQTSELTHIRQNMSDLTVHANDAAGDLYTMQQRIKTGKATLDNYDISESIKEFADIKPGDSVEIQTTKILSKNSDAFMDWKINKMMESPDEQYDVQYVEKQKQSLLNKSKSKRNAFIGIFSTAFSAGVATATNGVQNQT
jgi:hypothetical protein